MELPILQRWVGANHKIGENNNDDKKGSSADPNPTTIVIVHDFLDTFAN